MDLTFRPGAFDDTPAVFEVLAQASADVERRRGTTEAGNVWANPASVAATWARRGPFFAHLARTAERFWVAEQEGRIVGYARARLHGNLRELTEFFVLPAHQSRGIGRELLARAFPAEAGSCRAVLAASTPAALACYLKAGVAPRVPIHHFFARPRPYDVATDLTFEPITPGSTALVLLREIDREILGFARDADHQFLLGDRRGTLYRRDGRVVGYGYDGKGSGPFALLDGADFPAVLARAETDAAARGDEGFGVNVPLVNRAAVDHLLARRFQILDVTTFLMSDEPFGDLERYVVTSPPFFI